MRISEDMAQRHGRVLGELAELGLDMARDLKARSKAAATPQEAEGLALAFHRIARTVRLCLALESKLTREGYEIARLERARVHLAVERRRTQVRAVITGDIWSERDGADAESLIRELNVRLEEDGNFDAFLAGPVEPLIARIRADLGLAANTAGIAAQPPALRSTA